MAAGLQHGSRWALPHPEREQGQHRPPARDRQAQEPPGSWRAGTGARAELTRRTEGTSAPGAAPPARPRAGLRDTRAPAASLRVVTGPTVTTVLPLLGRGLLGGQPSKQGNQLATPRQPGPPLARSAARETASRVRVGPSWTRPRTPSPFTLSRDVGNPKLGTPPVPHAATAPGQRGP